MSDPKERISAAIQQAAGRYHRLVILVGRHGEGKTTILQSLAHQSGSAVLNVNLELSRRLIDLPRGQRPRSVDRLFRDLLARVPSDVVLLDNLEILFDPSLAIAPLRLLQAASRNRTIVASWGGPYGDGTLSYAVPGHPEYLAPQGVDAIVLPVSEVLQAN